MKLGIQLPNNILQGEFFKKLRERKIFLGLFRSNPYDLSRFLTRAYRGMPTNLTLFHEASSVKHPM